jgi:hypothetical protein
MNPDRPKQRTEAAHPARDAARSRFVAPPLAAARGWRDFLHGLLRRDDELVGLRSISVDRGQARLP